VWRAPHGGWRVPRGEGSRYLINNVVVSYHTDVVARSARRMACSAPVVQYMCVEGAEHTGLVARSAR